MLVLVFSLLVFSLLVLLLFLSLSSWLGIPIRLFVSRIGNETTLSPTIPSVRTPLSAFRVSHSHIHSLVRTHKFPVNVREPKEFNWKRFFTVRKEFLRSVKILYGP